MFPIALPQRMATLADLNQSMDASEERFESEDAIRAQLTEQRESLGHVQGLIAEDPHEPELSEVI